MESKGKQRKTQEKQPVRLVQYCLFTFLPNIVLLLLLLLLPLLPLLPPTTPATPTTPTTVATVATVERNEPKEYETQNFAPITPAALSFAFHF